MITYRCGNKEDTEGVFLLVGRVSATLLPLFKRVYVPCRSIVAQDNKKIIGVTTWAEKKNDEVVINWTVVHDQYRRRGICSKIISSRMKLLTNQKVKRVFTDVTDQFLVDFLETQGFTKFKIFNDDPIFGDLGHYQRMKKEL